MKKIRIGCGAGFSGDRLEPAVILAEKGDINYLVLECLAERTIALAQKRKLQDPSAGYDPLLERRISSLLPLLKEKGITLITNMGAANPVAAAQKIIAIAQQKNISLKVAAVSGDDVLPEILAQCHQLKDLEHGRLLREYPVISANAYMGADGILEALQQGARIIVTGRVADPSLFLAPMIHEFGWSQLDFDLLGKGTVTGHLLECAGQVTGGYFADPLKKPVEGMDVLGHPFADVFADGSSVISKVAGTGGMVTLATVKEQLLYEVVNPHEYYTPDVIADFTSVALKQPGPDRVEVLGGGGKQQPSTLKVSVGYKAFYLGEAEISYAGSGAWERAQLAGEIIQRRLQHQLDDLRVDYIGVQSAHRKQLSAMVPYEVRVRVAGQSQHAATAALIGEEVEALYTNGPAGGGGVRKYVTEVVGIVSTLLPAANIKAQVQLFES